MNDIEKSQERYENIIRKYNTKELLKFFSKMSILSYKIDENNRRGYTIIDLPYYIKRTGKQGMIKNVGYGQWELLQICYSAIKYSNDYRGKDVDNLSFYNLIEENRIYTEKLELAKSMNELMIFEHLQCLTNIQFDFQVLNITRRFNRMYEIMININKSKKYSQGKDVSYIDFDKVFKDITGISIKKFIDIYFFFILFSSGRNETNLNSFINDIKFDIEKIGFSKDDIVKVVEMQGKDYKFYRDSDNWNLLRFYPIVKTGEDYIISNIYALLIGFPESIYWILRNHYNKLKSRDFTSYFGKCFEFYLNEIFDYYSIKYEKLPERNEIKTPDWKIETDKYILLVEQKAALFPIDARVATGKERYKKLEEYLENNVVKAFKQLNVYEVENIKKTVIRICLTFEKIYMEENAKYIVEQKMNFKTNKDLNWIVTIDEFEVLMDLLSKDEERFNDIINKKIDLEFKQDENGRGFEKLLYGMESDYVMKKIDHFHNLADKLKEKLQYISSK